MVTQTLVFGWHIARFVAMHMRQTDKSYDDETELHAQNMLTIQG